MTLTHGSAFSGIGGAEVAADLAGGYEHAWAIEKAEHPAATIARRYPDLELHRDVTDQAVLKRLRPVDVLTAGFPCQPFSVAGRRDGANDERNLWPATAELVRVVRPRVAFLENVPALRNPHGREPAYLGTVLGDLASLGYVGVYDCIPASAVGAPHRRDRLWIVAFRSDVEPFDPFERFRAAPAPVTAWATPTATSAGGTPERMVERKAEANARGARSRGESVTDLRMQVEQAVRWPTPRAEDAEQTGGHRGALDTLTSAARAAMWRTPLVTDAQGSGWGYARSSDQVELSLTGQARAAMWPTPLAGDAQGGRTSKGRARPDEAGLRNSVRAALWPTPAAWDGERGPDYARRDRAGSGTDDLVTAAHRALWPTPRAAEHKGTGPLGSASQEHRLDRRYLDATVQEATQRSGVLNPEWVELLMGYPQGWTDRDVAEVLVDGPPPWPWYDEEVVYVGDVPGTNPDYAEHWLGPVGGPWPLAPRTPQTTPRLMALGNAWVPEVAAVILDEIREALS